MNFSAEKHLTFICPCSILTVDERKPTTEKTHDNNPKGGVIVKLMIGIRMNTKAFQPDPWDELMEIFRRIKERGLPEPDHEYGLDDSNGNRVGVVGVQASSSSKLAAPPIEHDMIQKSSEILKGF